jgi:phytanoyl-CoA hydroxylase
MQIDQASLQAFQDDGFLILRDFLSAEETADLEAKLERFIVETAPGLPGRDVMYENFDDPTSLKQINDVGANDPAFVELIRQPRFMELARTLLQDEVVPQHVTAFIKPPHQGTPTPAHQDGYYFNITPNEALTIWLPIGDIDSENGALCYIKGSHKHGVLPHGASGVLGFSQGLKSDPGALGEEVVCKVGRGDCLVHHSLTIHSAFGNPSPRPRRALGLVYYAARAREDKEAMERYYAEVRRQQAELGVS